jgi:hypothetical protein
MGQNDIEGVVLCSCSNFGISVANEHIIDSNDRQSQIGKARSFVGEQLKSTI